MVWKGCKKEGGADKILIIGLCSGCLAYFIQNQFSFGHIPIIMLFWLLIGMTVIASSIRRPLTERPTLSGDIKDTGYLPADSPINDACSPFSANLIKNHAIRRLVKSTICILVFCLSISVITFTIFGYKADMHFAYGQRLRQEGPLILEKIESYKTAIKYNPLEISYLNSLNGLYHQMVFASLKNEKSNSADNTLEYEQTKMWLSNTIDGSKKVLKLYPGDYYSSFMLGNAYHVLGRMGNNDMKDKAIKYYKQAIRLHPFMYKYRHNLSQLYTENGHHRKAVSELKEAIRIAPSKPLSYIKLAKIFIKDNERYPEALEVLLDFTEKYPDHQNADICKLINFIYFKTEKWDKVLTQSEKSLQLNGKDLETYQLMVLANFKLGRYGISRKLCSRLLELAGPAENKYSKYVKDMLKHISEAQTAETKN